MFCICRNDANSVHTDIDFVDPRDLDSEVCALVDPESNAAIYFRYEILLFWYEILFFWYEILFFGYEISSFGNDFYIFRNEILVFEILC